MHVKGGTITCPDEKEKYVHQDNEVISSKYHWYDFLFKNLGEQFMNLANVYFLLVGILQIFPNTTTTKGNPTMYQPLAFIVFVSALRAASEDWQRHKADNLRNGYKYKVLRGKEFVDVRSGDITPGCIVKIKKNDMVPADMVFIGSQLAKGHCFIDKANLNGETTLEVLSSLQATRPFCKDEASLAEFEFDIEYEPPNKRFDSLRAHISVYAPSGERIEVPANGKALLMRETNLKNCEYIYGIVVRSPPNSESLLCFAFVVAYHLSSCRVRLATCRCAAVHG